MTEIIKSEIAQIREQVKGITDDRAFIHLILTIFYKQNTSDHIITDGKEDGGVDFIYYNDEENKLILGQSKYTNTLDFNGIRAEYEKMYSTYQNFKRGNTGAYNADVKRELQNGIDQLPDDNSGSIEFCLFTTANNVDEEKTLDNIASRMPDFPIDCVKVFNLEAIENAIEAYQESVETVEHDKIKIDKARNFLEYESDSLKGLMCNVLSSSIVTLYNKYQNSGLFDLNIRRFVPNKLVDKEIEKTLKENRDNFWFLNNGIIIACEDYDTDGNTIHLYGFSIVNGGQTTHLIGKYKGEVTTDFRIPCKIVAVKNKKQAPKYFNDIAQASNSQKPIFPRDLRSNSKEMVALAKWLSNEKIYLEIKRGTKKPQQGKFKYSIKNDELGQLLLSFVYQKPGTSRSGKRTMFDNSDIYKKLFCQNYQKTIEKKQFLLDLIELHDRYKQLDTAYKAKNDPSYFLEIAESEILKNGKQTIFAIMGLCYRLANGDVTTKQVLENQYYAESFPFEYSSIISHYKKDDFDDKLKTIVRTIIKIVTDIYRQSFRAEKVSSVSNFMKTDARYTSEIVKDFIYYLEHSLVGNDIKISWDIFQRC